jgi:hypothetical protein
VWAAEEKQEQRKGMDARFIGLSGLQAQALGDGTDAPHPIISIYYETISL